MKKFFYLVLVFLLSGCGHGVGPLLDASSNYDPLNTKTITSFSLNNTIGVIDGNNIYVTMPYGTDRSSLIATYTTTGQEVIINGVIQENKVTSNDFTNPVTYTVKAENGSTRDYLITVNTASISAKEITQFSLNGTQGVINGNNIYITMPYGTNLSSLTASYIITGVSITVNNTTQINNQSTNSFINPAMYTVHAADGSTHDYVVTVNVANPSAKDITLFSLNGTTGVIVGNNINVIVPADYDVKSLTANYVTTGISITVNNIIQVNSQTENNYTNPVVYTVYAKDGTTQSYTVTVTVASNMAKDILSFSLNGTLGTINGNNIDIIMPVGSDVKSLTASYITTGTSVTVDNIVQVNGQTENNYTNPVVYTVYAANGTSQNYTVTVIVANPSSKDILSFSLDGIKGTIIGNNINVIVPAGYDVKSLVASYITTGIAVNVNNVTQISGQTENDYTNPVIYTVYAEDGTTQNYTVTVAIANPSSKDILSFSLNGTQGIITGNNINVMMPVNSDIKSLIASYITTGVSVSINNIIQVSGQTENDYTNPVIYTVLANDGTTQNYTVTVTVPGQSANQIIRFSLNGISGIVSGNNIDVTMPIGFDVKSLTASYITTGIAVNVNNVAQMNGVTPNNFTNSVVYTVLANDGTIQSYNVRVTVASSLAKEITSFFLNGIQGTINDNNITVAIPPNTNINSLVASYITTGSLVKVNGVVQMNGVTSNSFANPVTYTVIAQDGTVRDYIVTVVQNSNKEISLFSINDVLGNISNNSITISMPYGTNVKSLVAKYITTGVKVQVNGVDQINGLTPNNFTNPVTYTVQAEDGTVRDYVVTVVLRTNANKDMVAFSLNGTPGVISGNNISVTMPYGISPKSLVANYVITGIKVEVNGVEQANTKTVNNFTNPVTYVVQAEDGSTQEYIVNVIAGGLYVAGGTYIELPQSQGGMSWGVIATSKDSINWSLKYIASGLSFVSIAISDRGQIIAIDEGGHFTYSSDGVNWSIGQFDVNTTMRAIAVSNNTGRFVAVGDIGFKTYMTTSLDGSTWTRVPFDNRHYLNAIAANNKGQFVTGGVDGEMFRSDNGLTWDVIAPPTKEDIISIVADNLTNKFVAITTSEIISSTDGGKTWILVSNPVGAKYLDSIAVDSYGQFVAVGIAGTIITSIDGINWQSVVSGTSDDFIAVTVNKTGLFMALKSNGSTLSSYDRFHWSPAISSYPIGDLDLNCIATFN